MNDNGNTFSYDHKGSKPTYAYTAQTTEFDDECIRRGILTKADAICRKGASASEAHRLVQEDEQRRASTSIEYKISDEEGGNSSDDVLDEYRKKRIAELKEQHYNLKKDNGKKRFGSVIHISRPDWEREVTDASRNGQFVVINLTNDAVWESRYVEDAVNKLAESFDHIKFVSIRSTAAIENWPDSNLPTMFVYCDGSMQKQLVGIDSFGGVGVNAGRLEWILASFGVLKTNLKSCPPRSDYDQIFGKVVRLHQGMDPYDDVD